MPKYEKCPKLVHDIAHDVLCAFETHKPLLDAEVKIDFLFAYGDDKKPAIMSHGFRVIGLCRKIGLKDRVAGRGDAEILIDADWWNTASENRQRALLDHEMHHIEVTDKRDDIGRPVIKLRKHDVDFGWFSIVASRHGKFSIEREQAAQIMEDSGQWFWPEICGEKIKIVKRKVA